MTSINGSEFTGSVLKAYGLTSFGRTDPSLAEDKTSFRFAEKRLADSYFSGDASTSDGAWIALRDTIGNGIVSVSFAQVSQDALDGMYSRMEALKTEVTTLSQMDVTDPEFESQTETVADAEAELSQYIGQNLTARSRAVTIDASQGDDDQVTTINYIETLRLDPTDEASSDLAVIEISEFDFINAFHPADSCPICQSQNQNQSRETADGEGAAVRMEESTTYNAASGSPVTRVNSNADLTDNADTNTIISGFYWDDSSLSFSIYNSDDPVPFDYGSVVPDTVAAAATATNNMWDFRSDIQNWYNAVELATGLTFDEIVENPTTGEVGDIRVAFSDDVDGAGAFAFLPTNTNNYVGDIWFNDDDPDNFDLSLGTKGAQRGIHELGHSLGLSHPHDNGSYNNTNLGNLGFGDLDNYRYSVMTYNQGGTGQGYYYDRNMLNSYTVTFDAGTNFATVSYDRERVMPETPMILDIEALEHLYGQSTSNSGNTVHDVSTFGDAFIKTIVDAGTGETDTLDAGSTTRSNIINLGAGELSSINIKTQAEQVTELEDAIIAAAASEGVTLQRSDSAVQNRISYFTDTYLPFYDTQANPTADDGNAGNDGTALYTGVDNLAIARSATIENAIGGSDDDQINGNELDNAIQGNGGDDTIDGGTGSDTAVYTGARADYMISVNTGTTGSPTWTVYDEAAPESGNGEFKVEHLAVGSDGIDIMTRIEVLEFNDQQLTLATGASTTSFTSAMTAGSPADQPSTGGSGFTGSSDSGSSGSGGSSSSSGSGSNLVAPHGADGIARVAEIAPESALEIIDRAIQTVSDERAKLGALINALMHQKQWSMKQVEATAAAKSRIVDANYAFEAARLAKTQIIQQAGMAMLTQSNMQPRQTLNLLQ